MRLRLKVAMHPLGPDVGSRIGFLVLSDTAHGLEIEPDLCDLRPFGVGPGEHGLHVHERPDLEAGPGTAGNIVPGLRAGDHFDPLRTGSHQGPYGSGHLGDLPRLIVDNDGVPRQKLLAPRVKLNDILGRSVIIHEGPDNYTDNPPNGGGARRAVGGIVTDRCPYCVGPDGLAEDLKAIGLIAGALGLAYFVARDKD